MVPVDSDDLWYAYNLIAPGDSVMAVTVRYITIPYTLFFSILSGSVHAYLGFCGESQFHSVVTCLLLIGRFLENQLLVDAMQNGSSSN